MEIEIFAAQDFPPDLHMKYRASLRLQEEEDREALKHIHLRSYAQIGYSDSPQLCLYGLEEFVYVYGYRNNR